MVPTVTDGRVVCPECGRRPKVNRRGRIAYHKHTPHGGKPIRCPGSGATAGQLALTIGGV